ncbi:MAG: hypothetical protein RIC19_12840 [Phaeodactylibacter sp.]|uniref:hypothetical protein n=1 Tax=Phaeodactylibacter sp. TaxID=1940289 RepID=UPI0032ECA2CC
MSKNYYIGWDVGGWSCEKNSKSRDAIVILDESLDVIGEPWRGNLKDTLNSVEPNDHQAFIRALFELCGVSQYDEGAIIYLAIDTPLGYSQAFTDLVIKGKIADEPIGEHRENPYLFRRTERFLSEKGFRPLSAVQDMIGAQSTKGIHLLSKLGLKVKETGVWTKGNLTVIETYPTANRKTFKSFCLEGHEDIQDACICARVAHVFATERERLYQPTDDVPEKEGWIWAVNSETGDP